jgi:type I restriction enzyme M protein
MDNQLRDAMLNKVAGGYGFHNTSLFTFEKLKADPDNILANLHNYIAGFSEGAREIFLDKFEIDKIIDRLDKSKLLYMVFCKFASSDIDLHPDVVSNHDMGYIFEELIRRFSEQSNETAGEHFTPREVIKLMVNLLFQDDEELGKKGIIRTLLDPTGGTGGMLSTATEYLERLNPDGQLEVFGQELNPESYAICKSDMLIKGQDISHIIFGNSFTEDGFVDKKFDYFLSNPPFGVDWKKLKSLSKMNIPRAE